MHSLPSKSRAAKVVIVARLTPLNYWPVGCPIPRGFRSVRDREIIEQRVNLLATHTNFFDFPGNQEAG